MRWAKGTCDGKVVRFDFPLDIPDGTPVKVRFPNEGETIGELELRLRLQGIIPESAQQIGTAAPESK